MRSRACFPGPGAPWGAGADPEMFHTMRSVNRGACGGASPVRHVFGGISVHRYYGHF